VNWPNRYLKKNKPMLYFLSILICFGLQNGSYSTYFPVRSAIKVKKNHLLFLIILVRLRLLFRSEHRTFGPQQPELLHRVDAADQDAGHKRGTLSTSPSGLASRHRRT
jgi:hypothetical protein